MDMPIPNVFIYTHDESNISKLIDLSIIRLEKHSRQKQKKPVKDFFLLFPQLFLKRILASCQVLFWYRASSFKSFVYVII